MGTTLVTMKKYIGIFLLFFLLSLVITYPLIFHLSTYSLGKGDELLITWILNWDIHAFLTNPIHIFDANIFYPYAHTLSFSEPFFSSALLALIPTLILKNPLVAYNTNIILSLALLGFSTYCLVFYLTKKSFGAIIAGLLVSFSPFTLGRLFQLQVISIQWIPLSLLFFIRFLKDGKAKNAAFTSLFFILQVSNSFLPGYFLVLCYGVIITLFLLSKRISPARLCTTMNICIFSITAAVTILLGMPYFKTSKTFHYVRDIRDTIQFANRPEYTFYPNGRTRLEKVFLKSIYANDKGPFRYDGYWGLALVILFVFSCAAFFRIKKERKFFPLIFLLTAIFSFALSLGPAFQWGGKVIKQPFIIPLPYAVFYYLVPGFNGIRNSGRWEMLTVFAASVFVGLLLNELLRKKTKLFLVIIAIGILAEINVPFTYYQLSAKKDFPPVYIFIDTLPKKTAIIELPIFSWDVQPYSNIEFMREYYSTLHFRNTVNGYSGFSPKEWELNTKFLTKGFPDGKTISYLRKINVNYVILHKDDYDKLPGFSFERIKNNIDMFPELQFVERFENDYVYKLN